MCASESISIATTASIVIVVVTGADHSNQAAKCHSEQRIHFDELIWNIHVFDFKLFLRMFRNGVKCGWFAFSIYTSDVGQLRTRRGD